MEQSKIIDTMETYQEARMPRPPGPWEVDICPLDHMVFMSSINPLLEKHDKSLSKELSTPSGKIYIPIIYMSRLICLQLIYNF